MNPQLTISVLAVLLIVNSITTLVYWFRLREANKTIARRYSELTRTGEFWLEISNGTAEKNEGLRKDNAELQSKLNAAKDALK